MVQKAKKTLESTKESTKLFGAKIRIGLIKKIKHLSVDEGKSLSEICEEAFEDVLTKHSPKK
jgi:hypothetical protein